MLKRLRAAHPFVYCALAAVGFLAVMTAGMYLFTLLIVLLGPAAARPFVQEEFLLQSVNELFGLLVGLVLLARTGRLWVYRQRGRGFLDGLLVGMFPFVMVSFALSANLALAGPPEGAAVKAPWRIAAFFVCMFLIGLAEETLFRGVIAQTMLEHFGPGRAAVWKACFASGLIFGAMHLINLRASAPLGVLIQCCITAALGMLYAAIYFRTGNLWVLVFLHTLQDCAALINSGLYESTATISEVVSGYDPSMLASALIYLIPTVFLLRKKRNPEVAAFWGRCFAPPPESEQA